MGVVYKAKHEKLKRTVALKMVTIGPQDDERELVRSQAEAEAVARLHHPNIVQIFEVGEQDGSPYLALEFVTGGTLRDRLDGHPQPIRAAVQLVQQLARASTRPISAGSSTATSSRPTSSCSRRRRPTPGMPRRRPRSRPTRSTGCPRSAISGWPSGSMTMMPRPDTATSWARPCTWRRNRPRASPRRSVPRPTSTRSASSSTRC